MIYYCKDCGDNICSKTSIYGNGRCRKCSAKEQWTRIDFIAKRIGKLNGNYKDGRAIGPHFCKDCNKEISDYRRIRCSACENKYRFKGKTYEELYGINKATKLKNLRRENRLHTKMSIETKHKASLAHGGTGIPYENHKYGEKFTKELKEQIRTRDNYTCQNCGMTEEEHLIVYGQVLHVHHIDYNKKNCQKDNLITACLACNIRANYNRSYWQEFYNIKIEKEVNHHV